jgi:hypothetical protein
VAQRRIEPKVLLVLTGQITQASLIRPDLKNKILRSKFLACYFFGFAFTIAHWLTEDKSAIKAFVMDYFQGFYGGYGNLIMDEVMNNAGAQDAETMQSLDLGVKDAEEYINSLSNGSQRQPNGLVRYIIERRVQLSPLATRIP